MSREAKKLLDDGETAGADGIREGRLARCVQPVLLGKPATPCAKVHREEFTNQMKELGIRSIHQGPARRSVTHQFTDPVV